MRQKLLSRSEELALATAWRDLGSVTALHALIEPHGRLVIGAAIRFRGYGLPLGDLIQEGHIGLLHAARRFDPAREVLKLLGKGLGCTLA